jgi:hypothetical protein
MMMSGGGGKIDGSRRGFFKLFQKIIGRKLTSGLGRHGGKKFAHPALGALHQGNAKALDRKTRPP